ncbi:hypothetical protein TGGT1_247305 [Toxoplasma gondii GT1]|uniref:Uncharacterized protein n=5 Tax=Toxoplasma gondii TaxID=5811 RepID=S7V100_TOXGG|nr:hypothetical protein TGGT1_247305 [Toxoplasma gondii GT1]KAF4638532.1 hypothetical protein TGRH88_061400 [Toxoplasma gondii]KFG48113.1 hypothetical protein TGP89_247305 [Toxoplasma gondii p89]KFG54002.1 hypothetical protein TGFOU_247305 [Toxoplasma gondii FOU]RQX72026.1 hypothetical protein TGCAST_247305 [Toxoplasma gondii CAST]
MCGPDISECYIGEPLANPLGQYRNGKAQGFALSPGTPWDLPRVALRVDAGPENTANKQLSAYGTQVVCWAASNTVPRSSHLAIVEEISTQLFFGPCQSVCVCWDTLQSSVSVSLLRSFAVIRRVTFGLPTETVSFCYKGYAASGTNPIYPGMCRTLKRGQEKYVLGNEAFHCVGAVLRLRFEVDLPREKVNLRLDPVAYYV